jgi:hypothetical protein
MALKMREALSMRTRHQGIFTRFTAKFSPEVIEKWTKMIEDWDQDLCKPDPYQESVIGPFGVLLIL